MVLPSLVEMLYTPLYRTQLSKITLLVLSSFVLVLPTYVTL